MFTTQTSRYISKNLLRGSPPTSIHLITMEIFEHLEITSPMYVYQRVSYTQRIITVSAFKKHKAVLVECKQSENQLAGDKWELGTLKDLYTDDFWTWAQKDGIGYDRDAYLGLDKCVDFEVELWFDFGKVHV